LTEYEKAEIRKNFQNGGSRLFRLRREESWAKPQGRRVEMDKIEMIEREQMRMDLPQFIPGDTVKVHVKIKEGEKERLQAFQGVVISKRRGSTGATFTVRKVSYGVGVERIFPLHSPAIDRVEIITHGRVRRAKLYYLRNLRGKAARIREKRPT
jgi:large subunit ribosomal protein L19